MSRFDLAPEITRALASHDHVMYLYRNLARLGSFVFEVIPPAAYFPICIASHIMFVTMPIIRTGFLFMNIAYRTEQFVFTVQSWVDNSHFPLLNHYDLTNLFIQYEAVLSYERSLLACVVICMILLFRCCMP